MIQLYPYQAVCASHLERAIRAHKFVLDSSDTGTGKTFVALEVARRLEKRPLILCPKAVVTKWMRAAKDFGVDPLGVLNVEKLKTGKTPFLRKLAKNDWRWLLQPDSLVIWDEVHTAGGFRSQNGKILALAKAYRLFVHMASATVADSPLKLKAIGYLLGLHNYKDHTPWCMRMGCRVNFWGGLEFAKGPRRLPFLNTIHKAIYPDRGYRVRIADLGDAFPENAVFAEAFDLAEYQDEVNAIYDEMEDELKKPSANGQHLTIMLRARQRVELFKVPVLCDLTSEALEEDKSVVVFVNFRETLDVLREEFKEASVIYGGQAPTYRAEQVARFMDNHSRVCLCMIQAGGVGLDLDDKTGEAPRISLVSPGYDAVQLKQALGRIHRASTRSKCIQKIVFAANTIEERACSAVQRKLASLDVLNSGLTDSDLA